ncbi:hypothetical protein [Clostridium sp.]|uniref:hypothetical protein n=1 Tax=Clostridium sp. TaxID=1506 RepID=UPI0032167E69
MTFLEISTYILLYALGIILGSKTLKYKSVIFDVVLIVLTLLSFKIGLSTCIVHLPNYQLSLSTLLVLTLSGILTRRIISLYVKKLTTQ